jgi:5-methylcytosine-specific restriction endonuclease McrA
MATNRNGAGHRAYRRKQAQLKRRTARESLVCAWCGEPIDITLPPTDRMSFTADHPEAVANDGHLVRQELAPMHRSCNSKKGNRAEVEIWEAS